MASGGLLERPGAGTGLLRLPEGVPEAPEGTPKNDVGSPGGALLGRRLEAIWAYFFAPRRGEAEDSEQ